MVETLHEKNSKLVDPQPISFSKRLYDIENNSDYEDYLPHNNNKLTDSAEKKKRTPRRKKLRLVDPNAPKRPLNVFMVFSEMQRETMKQERKDLERTMPNSEDLAALKNLSKATAARWKSLPDDEKQGNSLFFIFF